MLNNVIFLFISKLFRNFAAFKLTIMERNENLTLGIDFGSESVGISMIDTENHTISPSVSIWKANTSKERN